MKMPLLSFLRFSCDFFVAKYMESNYCEGILVDYFANRCALPFRVLVTSSHIMITFFKLINVDLASLKTP